MIKTNTQISQKEMVTGKFYKFASQKRMDKPSRMRYIIYRQEDIFLFILILYLLFVKQNFYFT